MIDNVRKYAFIGFLAIAGCANNVKKEEFLTYQRNAEASINTLKEQIAETQNKASFETNAGYEALLKRIEELNARLSVASLDNYATALEEQITENARQFAQLALKIAASYKKEWEAEDATAREFSKLRADAKATDDALAAKIAELNKQLADSKEAYETLKIDVSKAPIERPGVETYKCPMAYENPLIAQMLPGIVKAAYQRAVQSNEQKDWAVYEIAARFFVDQNIDNAPHDGTISNAEFKKFVDEHPDLELVVSSDKLADEFKVEFPESYKAKWREIRAKVNRIADLEQKDRWSDVEFVRYALMPGMERTPDGKGYFTSQVYSDHFEGRINSAIEELEGKK